MRSTTKILAFLPALLLSGCYVTVEPGAPGSYQVAQPEPTPVQIAQPILPGVPANPQIVPQPAQIVRPILPGQTWHPHWMPKPAPAPVVVRPILPGQTLNPHMAPQPAQIVHPPILPGQTQHPVPVIIKPVDPCKDPKNPGCHNQKPTGLVLAAK